MKELKKKVLACGSYCVLGRQLGSRMLETNTLMLLSNSVYWMSSAKSRKLYDKCITLQYAQIQGFRLTHDRNM
jgi:hypothetical protein